MNPEAIIKQNVRSMEPLPTDTPPLLNPLPGIRAVLFDIYGTLFISGSGDVGTASAINRSSALQEALAAAGFQGDLEQAGQTGCELLIECIKTSHAEAHDRGVECPEVDILSIWKLVTEQLVADGSLNDKAGDIPSLAIEYECRVNPVCPMPYAGEQLKQLRERGIILGIVSNAQFYTPLLFPALLNQSLSDIGFDPACCIWSYVQGEAKPAPRLFTEAANGLKRHGISLKETAYVGNDMLNDMYGAGSAGCRTILFAGDRRSLRLREKDPRCLAFQPDAVITSLDQLSVVLGPDKSTS